MGDLVGKISVSRLGKVAGSSTVTDGRGWRCYRGKLVMAKVALCALVISLTDPLVDGDGST